MTSSQVHITQTVEQVTHEFNTHPSLLQSPSVNLLGGPTGTPGPIGTGSGVHVIDPARSAAQIVHAIPQTSVQLAPVQFEHVVLDYEQVPVGFSYEFKGWRRIDETNPEFPEIWTQIQNGSIPHKAGPPLPAPAPAPVTSVALSPPQHLAPFNNFVLPPYPIHTAPVQTGTYSTTQTTTVIAGPTQPNSSPQMQQHQPSHFPQVSPNYNNFYHQPISTSMYSAMAPVSQFQQ